jgi:hypothetical protein
MKDQSKKSGGASDIGEDITRFRTGAHHRDMLDFYHRTSVELNLSANSWECSPILEFETQQLESEIGAPATSV